jgi:hypothetical protein
MKASLLTKPQLKPKTRKQRAEGKALGFWISDFWLSLSTFCFFSTFPFAALLPEGEHLE